MLGVAYSCSIGGISTKTGTGTNLAFMGIYSNLTGQTISYGRWTGILVGLPISVWMILAAWMELTLVGGLGRKGYRFPTETLKARYEKLGKTTMPEIVVEVLCVLTVLGWFFRAPAWGPGLSDLFPDWVSRSAVSAAAMSVETCVPPLRKTAAEHLWFPFFQMVCVLMAACLSQTTSDVAVANILLPITFGVAKSMEIDPLLLMLPVGLACSLPFTLVVSTPPNAIAFQTGLITQKDLLGFGLPLTILGMLILPLGSIFHVGSIPKRARFGARPGPGLLRFEPQKLVDELSFESPDRSNSEFSRIDVLEMVQVNISKGTRRNIHRHQGHGKNWSMWQYEAERAEGRNYTHSKTTLVCHDSGREVCIALEDCWRHARAEASRLELEGAWAVDRQRAESAWRWKLQRVTGGWDGDWQGVGAMGGVERSPTLRRVFEGDADGELLPMEGEPVQPSSLAAEARLDGALREVLLEAALRQHAWPVNQVVEALYWLQDRGLELSASHVRKAALLHGLWADQSSSDEATPSSGLVGYWSCVARVAQEVFLEAQVDVRGLELLVDHRAAANLSSGNTSGGGWVQRCKPALKALLARGAVLGSHSLQSRLLKRLEEDGMALWVQRVLEALRRQRPELPEAVLQKIREFT
eukprot:g10907.t1